jgi:hypothetical protein
MKIILDSFQLKSILKREIKNACGFEWSGWRIPIYVKFDEENKGTFSSGGWLSKYSWQPNSIEVYKIEKWDLIEENVEYTEEWTRNNEIEEQIFYILDDVIDIIKKEITKNILFHFQNKFTPSNEEIENIEIDWDGDDMKDINYDMRNGVLITPYQIICLLRKNIGSQENNV